MILILMKMNSNYDELDDKNSMDFTAILEKTSNEW